MLNDYRAVRRFFYRYKVFFARIGNPGELSGNFHIAFQGETAAGRLGIAIPPLHENISFGGFGRHVVSGEHAGLLQFQSCFVEVHRDPSAAALGDVEQDDSAVDGLLHDELAGLAVGAYDCDLHGCFPSRVQRRSASL